MKYLEFIACVLGWGSYVPYFISAVKGRSNPNVVSWSLTTLFAVVLAATASKAGVDGGRLWLCYGSVVGSLAIAIVALAARQRKFRRIKTVEVFAIVLALGGFFLLVGEDELLNGASIAVALLTQLVIWIPTIEQVTLDPESEPLLPWAMSLAANLLNLAAVPRFDSVQIALPAWFSAMSAFMVVAVVWPRKVRVRR